MRDTFALGAASGVVGTLPALALNYLLKEIGLSKYYSFQLSGSVYLVPGLTDEFWGLIFGALVWFLASAVLGVALVYVMKATGKDYWWLKGAMVAGTLMFLITYGFLFTLGGARIVPYDIATNMSVLAVNIVYGIATGYFIVRWGQDLHVRA